jgi:AcrR family transcriptional regulator
MTADHSTESVSQFSDALSLILADPSQPGARDARAEKSSLALQNAMLALLETKPLEQITVRQIAAKAGVHYATFFRHHPTKESLLNLIAADQIDRLMRLTLPIMDTAGSYAAVLTLCNYVHDHRILWTILLTGGAADSMRAELLCVARALAAAQGVKDSWVAVDLAVNCSVSLIFETLAWWLAQPPGTITVESVARTLCRLLLSVQL